MVEEKWNVSLSLSVKLRESKNRKKNKNKKKNKTADPLGYATLQGCSSLFFTPLFK